MILLLGICLTALGFTVTTPGDFTTENAVTADRVELPLDSTLACDSVELAECIAATVELDELTTELLTVDTISGISGDVHFYGRLQFAGNTEFSFVQLSSEAAGPVSSFLEVSRNRHWREVGLLGADKVTLPKHSHLMVSTAVHFTDAFDQETLKLLVDGRLAWLETYIAQSHTGQWTSTIKAILKHEAAEALIEFQASQKTGYSVDPILLYVK